MRRWFRLISGAVLATAVLGLPAIQNGADNSFGGPANGASDVSLAAATPYSFRVVDQNVGTLQSAITAALNRADSVGASVITLQEVCVQQMTAIRSAHPDWTVAWHPGIPGNCPDGGVTGQVAINTVVNGARTGERSFNNQVLLPQKQVMSDQGMACVTWGAVRHVCSVHMVAVDQDVAYAEAQEVRTCMRNWVDAGDMVIVAGDFNASPEKNVLNPMYAPSGGGAGQFWEVSPQATGATKSRDGASTVKGTPARKIDYVFLSTSMWSGSQSSLALFENDSDHKQLSSNSQITGPTSSSYTNSSCGQLN